METDRSSPTSADSDDRSLGERDLSGPAARTYLNIAKAWNMTESEESGILGYNGRAKLQAWRNCHMPDLDTATLARISHVLGIFRAINTILPVADRADSWLRRQNQAPALPA